MFRLFLTTLLLVALPATNIRTAELSGDRPGSAADVAVEVDRLILEQLSRASIQPAAVSTDEDFLRRATLDIAGTLPTARDVTLFGLNPDPHKRQALIERLVASDDYAGNWARYWRDVIVLRATNMRTPLVSESFMEWMTGSLKKNHGWDRIATEIVTATGNVQENGATALIFAQEGVAEDITGEVSRIFLGIQMQCANCHDHPWDKWKRDQFHEMAAFFPRISLRPIVQDGQQRGYEVVSFEPRQDARRTAFQQNPEQLFRFMDRNRDGKLTKNEVENSPLGRNWERTLEAADRNKDGALDVTEMKYLPQPPMNMPGRGAAEHFMPDLANPSSPGAQIDPRFFVTSFSPDAGLADVDRRQQFAAQLTSHENVWFAKSFVNRMWAELTGQGFYMPIDDMGPERTASFPAVLDLLSSQFAQHDYDIRWLIQTIALTQTYQRGLRSSTAAEGELPFASATPTRLRGDQLYSAITTALGGEPSQGRTPPRRGAGGPYRGPRTPRDQFAQQFGFDPSTPQADITGTVPQALFMMNSPLLAGQINASGPTRLAQLLQKYPDDQDAVAELYLMVLSREPSDHELKVFREYLAETGRRGEAFEDLMWSLLNSSEFLSKR